jgi:hypothetical protein
MRLRSPSTRLLPGVLAPALCGAPTHPLQAATDTEIGPAAPPPRKDETRVPIPGFSPEVRSNGCQVRQSPDEVTQVGKAALSEKAGLPEIPFFALIEHATGVYSVHAGLEPPEAFAKRIAPLDDDLRRLVLLHALQRGFGFRDGLHTFFFMRGGSIAPAIRDALKEAGLAREHSLFTRAMGFFGTPYPVDNEARYKLFGYAREDGNLNAFDHALLAVDHTFGTREQLADAIVAYVNRNPALFARIEALREKLGDSERLRYLLDTLGSKIDWEKGADDIARQLSVLPAQERNLIALSMFNMELEDGGVHQFFYNSSGDIAPEVLAAMVELGLVPQAKIFRRALAMLGEPYIRDNTLRREQRFDGKSPDWDKALSKLTDDFYAIGGGAKAYSIKGDLAFEGGPGLRHAMVTNARNNKMLPC